MGISYIDIKSSWDSPKTILLDILGHSNCLITQLPYNIGNYD